MVVSILYPLTMGDAGRARVLTVGQAYDLPDVIARRLVSRGMAALLTEPAARDCAVTGPAETGFRRRGRR